MEISDVARARSCLKRIGYYRLSAYWYSFRKSQPHNDPVTNKTINRVLDDFRDGTNFPTIHELYIFDKKLRLLVLDALERIEIGVRTDIAIRLGEYDKWAHRKPDLLDGNFSKKTTPERSQTKHENWLLRLDKKFNESKEDFAKHFKEKYPNDKLPIWIAVELWDFGTLSHFFSGLKMNDQDAIALQYGVPSGRIFKTWLRCLNDVRNICAHHSRLWNRPLVNQPAWPLQGLMPDLDHLERFTF